VRALRPEQVQQWLGLPLPRVLDSDEEACALARGLRRARLDGGALRAHAAFRARGYTRRVLGAWEGWEVVLVGWLPGQATRVHDHGTSWGAIRVLSGWLDEQRFHAGRSGLFPAAHRCLRAGSAFHESPEVIHRVSNPATSPAVSLHLYSPTPLRMRTYRAGGVPPRGG
jgi:cysteine dioxygenase